MNRISQATQLVVDKIPGISLGKKWTLAGLALAGGAFFSHPEACVSSKDILSFFVPNTVGEGASHYGTIIGIGLAVLGKGLLHKDK